MKTAASILFLATAISTALSGLYAWSGYLSGLPTAWWSGPLVVSLLIASVGKGVAGVATPFYPHTGRILAMFSGSFLEFFLLLAAINGLSLLVNARQSESLAWGPFVGFVLTPFALTTTSLILAWKIR